MVRHKSKDIGWLFLFFIMAMEVTAFAAGYYIAKGAYQQQSLYGMQDCMDAYGILRNSKVFYYSYTKALNQRQDYYIECDGNNLINITPLGSPIFLDNFTGGFCL
jgi:hypothetical protein